MSGVYFTVILFFWKPLAGPYIGAVSGPVTFLVNITQPRDPISLTLHQHGIVVEPEAEKVKNDPDKRRYFFIWRDFQANVAITVALILATPGIAWPRRFKLASIALLLLVGLHVLDMFAEVKRIYFMYYGTRAVATYPQWEVAAVKGLNRFFLVFRMEAMPFLLWGALCLRDLFFSRPVIDKAREVGRNSPCPCGSGRKFKHCCGR